jgi:hypothetical protein
MVLFDVYWFYQPQEETMEDDKKKTHAFTLRLDPDTYIWLRNLATTEMRTMSDQCRWILRQYRIEQARHHPATWPEEPET